MAYKFTKQVAEYLADQDEGGDYYARKGRDGYWYVWSAASDHYVEFDQLGHGTVADMDKR
jgi:hypothetical protein